MNFIKSASSALKNSNMVIVAFLIFLVMLVVSIMLGIEDYSTNKLGYELLPTRKANEGMSAWVALVPQVAQAGFLMYFMFNTGRRWALVISLSMFMVDVFFDVWFKTNSMTMGAGGLAIALVESIVLYTIGSEVMLSVSSAMLLELVPDFFRQLGEFSSNIFKSATDGDEPK